MNKQEKLSLLEETLQLDKGSLSEKTELKNIQEWDSMGKLSLIVMFDESFNKKLSSLDINRFFTVSDILSLMN